MSMETNLFLAQLYFLIRHNVLTAPLDQTIQESIRLAAVEVVPEGMEVDVEDCLDGTWWISWQHPVGRHGGCVELVYDPWTVENIKALLTGKPPLDA